jgi:hypothetical protein
VLATASLQHKTFFDEYNAYPLAPLRSAMQRKTLHKRAYTCALCSILMQKKSANVPVCYVFTAVTTRGVTTINCLLLVKY